MDGALRKCPKCEHYFMVPVVKATGHKQICPQVQCVCQNCLSVDQYSYDRNIRQMSAHEGKALHRASPLLVFESFIVGRNQIVSVYSLNACIFNSF